VELVKLVEDVQIRVFLGPYNCPEEPRFTFVVAIEVKPCVYRELVVSQEPILRNALAHMINLQVLEVQTVLLIFKFFQSQIFQFWIISESIEIVVHQNHASEVLYIIENVQKVARKPGVSSCTCIYRFKCELP